ncbi:MAG TPA: 50S ribosomal protein L18 [Chthonomonadaceae bacterium]|nr:50S ribosomal protein L18 [Chthonomonadaceae bacterium]
MRLEEKELLRRKRHRRVRAKVSGTSERPRLNVSRSLQHIYAQVIDDTTGRTLAHASTVDADLRKSLKSGGNVEAAKAVGKLIAERAKSAGIDAVVFDRGGYMYHGRVQALADSAREGGLQF